MLSWYNHDCKPLLQAFPHLRNLYPHSHYLAAMNNPIISRSRYFVTLTCAVAITAISLAVLAGWILDIAFLKTVLPNFPVMKPNTAIALAIFGVGLFCSANFRSENLFGRAASLCGFAVCLIGAVSLAEYLAGSDLGIDTIIIPASKHTTGQFPGRMSPHAAFNFALLGLSLVMLNARSLLQKISEFLVGIVSATTFAAVLGFLYKAEQLYGISSYNSMALHTAGLFLICTLGLFAANTGSRSVRLLTSKSLGGSTARKLLPAVIFIPAVAGWLRVLGQDRGYYDTGFGAAMTIFVCVTLMCVIVLFICSAIHTSDSLRRSAENELAEKEQRYRELFDYGQSMICIHDLDGVLTTVNPAAAHSIGYEREELIGRNIRDFMPEELRPQFPAFLRQIENEGAANGSFALIAKNRKRIVWQYQSILVSEPEKEPYVLGNAQDITKLVEAKDQLKNLSLTDDLTGLYNRRGFQTLAEQQIKLERHQGTARGLTLMFADLDGLKQINDQYGHEAGSDAIIAFSKILRSALRDADLVSRWGGDEFVILAIGAPGETSDMIIARIHTKLQQHNSEGSSPYDLACSIGVTPVPNDGQKSFESLIAEADQAMYQEKRRRKLNSIAA